MNRNTVDIIKVIVIAIFVMMSVIGWAYRQFKAHQANQERKAAALRRREQMLRTGRFEDESEQVSQAQVFAPSAMGPGGAGGGGGSVHDDARRKLQEIAAQRRRELEELSRRAAAGGGGGGGAGGRPTITRAPARTPRPPTALPLPQPQQRAAPVSRPTVPSRAAPQRAKQQRNAQQDAARREAEQAAHAAELRRRAERERASRARTEADLARTATEDETSAFSHSEAAVTAPGAMRASMEALRTPTGTPRGSHVEQWRRAIVMMELLGPPACVREGDQRMF